MSLELTLSPAYCMQAKVDTLTYSKHFRNIFECTHDKATSANKK